jgi:hypothetical protein
VLLGALSLLASVVTFSVVRPAAPVAPVAVPAFEGETDTTGDEAATNATLYVVTGNVERLLDVGVTGDRLSERLLGIAAALHDELSGGGFWPSGVLEPQVYVVNVGRDTTVVLDVTPGARPLAIERERDLIASYERTLLGAGADAVAYLQNGRATGQWLGNLAVDADLSNGARSP